MSHDLIVPTVVIHSDHQEVMLEKIRNKFGIEILRLVHISGFLPDVYLIQYRLSALKYMGILHYWVNS